jgi:hypothetical protein
VDRLLCHAQLKCVLLRVSTEGVDETESLRHARELVAHHVDA